MQTVTMDQAREQLPELIDAATRGEGFLITQEGRPLVQVTVTKEAQPASERPPLKFGSLAGKISVPHDFDTLFQDEIIAMFEGDGKL